MEGAAYSALCSGYADEEKLIETVRGFPCLWQVSALSYRDSRVKENSWKLVASQISISFVLLMWATYMYGRAIDNSSLSLSLPTTSWPND